MMQPMFPRALVACISEARPPEPREFDEVAAKILREAFGGRAGERMQRLAGRAANAALNGHVMAA